MSTLSSTTLEVAIPKTGVNVVDNRVTSIMNRAASLLQRKQSLLKELRSINCELESASTTLSKDWPHRTVTLESPHLEDNQTCVLRHTVSVTTEVLNKDKFTDLLTEYFKFMKSRLSFHSQPLDDNDALAMATHAVQWMYSNLEKTRTKGLTMKLEKRSKTRRRGQDYSMKVTKRKRLRLSECSEKTRRYYSGLPY